MDLSPGRRRLPQMLRAGRMRRSSLVVCKRAPGRLAVPLSLSNQRSEISEQLKHEGGILASFDFHTEPLMPSFPSFRLAARSVAAAALLCGIFAAPALLCAQQPYKILDR